MARGYLNRPELTAERFVPHPFSSEPGARLYKTGDLVRYRPNGILEFLGRNDHQIKLHGFRIELDEIEALLGQHAAVAQAVVTLREDIPGDPRLVAYFVSVSGSTSAAEDLRAALAAHLPVYMLPSAFVCLDALPLTPNGKVDRRALPIPEARRSATEHTGPRDHVEQQLVALWEQALGVIPVGIHDNFFDLGGHSLLAVRLVAAIQRTLAVDLPLAAFFQAQTIAQLALLCRTPQLIHQHSLLIPLRTTGAHPPFFCLSGEQRLLPYLPADLPYYISVPCGLDGRPSLVTMESMAAEYRAEIQAVQPHGPYILGGFSFGGVLSFEVARQLQALGEPIMLLVLLDPPPLVTFAERPPRLTQQLAALREATAANGLEEVGRAVWRRVRRRTTSWLSMAYVQTERRAPSWLRKDYGKWLRAQAWQRHSPQPFPGRALLFQTTDRSEGHHREWARFFSQGMDLHQLDFVDHLIFQDPYLPTWASHLVAALQQARQTSRLAAPPAGVREERMFAPFIDTHRAGGGGG